MAGNIKYKFLTGVLGVDGSNALRKAEKIDNRLKPIVVPRAIIGWLKFISNYEYEGCLPNLDNTYLHLHKNEFGNFDGSISIDDEIHEFNNSDIYHIASAISVSIDEDLEVIDESVKDLVLVKLGKSIDTLIKAQELARTLDFRDKEAEDLTKAISSIPRGQSTGEGYDYSHVLSPEHRKAGYSLHVVPVGENEHNEAKLESQLFHGPKQVGVLEAYHLPRKGILQPDVAILEDEHKGKGLGQAMYEAMFAHGWHNGVRNIEGAVHSTEASRVHTKLAGKHGLEGYNPRKRARMPGRIGTAFDSAFGPYKYTLKNEIDMGKSGVDLPGQTAKPIKQQGPTPPLAPSRKQTPEAKPAKLKIPSLKIGKSESERVCNICGGKQFSNNKFIGCICFRSESPLIKTFTYSDGYVLEFGKDFSASMYITLSKYFRE